MCARGDNTAKDYKKFVNWRLLLWFRFFFYFTARFFASSFLRFVTATAVVVAAVAIHSMLFCLLFSYLFLSLYFFFFAALCRYYKYIPGMLKILQVNFIIWLCKALYHMDYVFACIFYSLSLPYSLDLLRIIVRYRSYVCMLRSFLSVRAVFILIVCQKLSEKTPKRCSQRIFGGNGILYWICASSVCVFILGNTWRFCLKLLTIEAPFCKRQTLHTECVHTVRAHAAQSRAAAEKNESERE